MQQSQRVKLRMVGQPDQRPLTPSSLDHIPLHSHHIPLCSPLYLHVEGWRARNLLSLSLASHLPRPQLGARQMGGERETEPVQPRRPPCLSHRCRDLKQFSQSKPDYGFELSGPAPLLPSPLPSAQGTTQKG